MSVLSPQFEKLLDMALQEDVGGGDKTTEICVPTPERGIGIVKVKQDLVLCGQEIAQRVFLKLDPQMRYEIQVQDGTKVNPGTSVATVKGSLAALLTGERTALNFLQRLSGISTKTASLVKILEGSSVQLLDTRKTTPGWRELEKYAVRCGGGHNHRMGLYDAVLLKNNHIDISRKSIQALVQDCRIKWGHSIRVQVEVRNEDEFESALAAAPDALLFDNFKAAELKKYVTRVRSSREHAKLFLEASGGISQDNLKEFRIDGLNAVSSGSITHSATAVDISFSISRSISSSAS